MTHTKTVNTIEAVIQRNPCGTNWYAGYGSHSSSDNIRIGMGSYLESTCETYAEAKAEAIALAKAYRNTVLTLGGCTFETLPKIKFVNLSK